MTFHFRPAVRENVGLLIALAGASGSGKTFSALRLAQGISGGKPIAFIDTEARRGLHYADKFKFLHADMHPPFRPENFVEGIAAAEKSGAGVVIIDSFSHEYDGEGGIMDWADELAEKGVKSPGNWKEPKGAHKRLMQKLLQVRCHLIFCLRADEKIEIVRENGKTAVKPIGWMPICEKRFMYEMTASFTLIPSAPGLPQFNLPHKLQDQHRAFFPSGKVIDENAGKMLADWATGGKQPETVGEILDALPPVKMVLYVPQIGDGSLVERVYGTAAEWAEAFAKEAKYIVNIKEFTRDQRAHELEQLKNANADVFDQVSATNTKLGDRYFLALAALTAPHPEDANKKKEPTNE